jgi:hypothetical protein
MNDVCLWNNDKDMSNVCWFIEQWTALSVFSFVKFKFKFKLLFEKLFFNMEIINQGRQVITTATVKYIIEAGNLKQPPQLII